MTGYTSYVFNFKDTLSTGLTFKGITSVTVGSGENVQNVTAGTGDNTYTLTQDGQNITITMNNFLASNANKAGQEIKVTYTATLNKDAVTGLMQTRTLLPLSTVINQEQITKVNLNQAS